MIRVAVSSMEYDKARAFFTSGQWPGYEFIRVPCEEAVLAEIIREQDVRHVIVGVERYSDALYDALPAVGVIARFGVGHDGIDKELATRRKLLCTNTPGALDDSVAELTITLILAASRQVADQVQSVRAGQWCPVVGCEVRGKHLAIIGCGEIGCRVARIASMGLGMNVVGCDVRNMDVVQLKREWGFAEVVDGFANAVEAADFVSLHIPSTAETKGYVDGGRLALTRDSAWLINTSRGAVVDEVDLYDTLAGGGLGGAALDVFINEPYVPSSPEKDLRTLGNVIMTPHIGSSTREACLRMAEQAVHNIRLADAGRFKEMDLLNPSVLGS